MVAYLNKEKPWCARMEYNVTGQEVARKVSGGVIGNFSYDEAGRPVQHMIRGQKESIHRHRRYEWDVNYRLKKVTNELTKGNIIYSYDRFSNLISARGTEILSCFRMFDEAGNVYETEDKSDRIYGAGSRLETSGIDLKEKRNIYQGGHGRLVTKGVEYFYDEEGNLVRKTEAAGEESKWETIGGVRIRRPNTELQKPHTLQGDNTSVYRGENALQPGSEQKASHVEKVIKFLWDGNVLLHEWQEDAAESKKPVPQIDYQADYVVKLSEKKKQEERQKAAKGEPAPESLVTWIFQDDFIPRARITKDGIYSIMTDYLGTPAEAYDDSGTLVWKRELDINGKIMPAGKDRYGRTMEDIGEKNFIPFRFQGQYEDEEAGLYYNRFRYYNPETGQYTQQDPIGLAGGNPTLYGYVCDTNVYIDVFGLNPFGTIREALRYAKDLAGIPRSQQPIRQWIVTGDVMKYENYNYVVSSNQTSHGRYYEFLDADGNQKVVVLHTNDPNRSIHAHAGKAPDGTKMYDFKSNNYDPIDDIPNHKDHHLDINCKG